MSRDDPREDRIESHFVARMLNCGYINLKGDMAAEKRVGLSDQFFFGHGPRTVIVEFKRLSAPRRRKGEKLQAYWRQQFKDRKYEVYLARGKIEAARVFKQITGEELYG